MEIIGEEIPKPLIGSCIEIPSSPLSLSSFSLGERGSRPCAAPCVGSPLSRYLASLPNSSDVLRAVNTEKDHIFRMLENIFGITNYARDMIPK